MNLQQANEQHYALWEVEHKDWVIRQLGGIRVEGVLLEDMEDVVLELQDPKVSTFFWDTRVGIPSCYVACESGAKWIEVRQVLRDKGLAR